MEELITYRLAGDADIDPINAFYNRIYHSNRTREKFSWEYNSSPAGKAIYVIAMADGRVIGTQCAIPYYLTGHDSKPVLSAKSEDTLIDPAFRGKQVFEKMYLLLIDECKKAGIELIWGFTYAIKPFKKIGFDVPFQSQLGLLVMRPLEAFRYYSRLSGKTTLIRNIKVFGLCVKSWCDFIMLKFTENNTVPEIREERTALNTADFNYISRPGYFGLSLNKDFLDYRLYTNPYSKNYFQYSAYENGELNSSMFFTINKGLGYILHIYTSEKNSDEKAAAILKKMIFRSALKNCYTVRFWGFAHNEIMKREIAILKQLKFTFLNRGISFVSLNLSKNPELQPERFILSRLASQGTD